jgi:hypothetical protein
MSHAPTPEVQPFSVPKMAAWTFGPMVFFLLVAWIFGKTQLTPTLQRWTFPLVLITACAGQCRAWVITTKTGKDRHLLTRVFAFLLTATSFLMLLFWVSLIVSSGYYLLHPNAAPLFGGK